MSKGREDRITLKNRMLARGGFWSDVLRDRQLYLMLLPFLAFYILFAYVPMYGLQIAFRNFRVTEGIAGSEWVGLSNFIRFFNDPHFWRILRNTLLISVYGILWGFPIPIALAILLNEVKRKRLRNAFQTSVLIPHFVSIVVMAGIVRQVVALEAGLVNNIITFFGGERINFLMEPGWFRTIFITMGQWQAAGFASIIYLAAIAGIDQQLYEAAVIDGANKWKQIKHVTLPGILPTFVILFIMGIGNMLNVGFEAVLLLYNPITRETGDIINTWVFRMGIATSVPNHSLATAVGLFNGVVGLLLVIGANHTSRKLTESALW